MEGFTSKRPDDSSPPSGGAGPTDTFHCSSVAPISNRYQIPGPLLKSTVTETLFRLLCPSEKTGSVIGKGGAIVRQIREQTGARVRIEDPVPGSNDRVVLIVSESNLRRRKEGAADFEEEPSSAQRALVRVFERIVRGEEGENGYEKDGQGTAHCRLLVSSGHVGCVLGKGGKIVEKIRLESGAHIRVLAHDLVPPCALAGDEVIQITGNFFSVKKALLSVARCLQDNIKVDPTSLPTTKAYMGGSQGHIPHAPLDIYPQRGYLFSPRGTDNHHRAYLSNQPLDNIPSNHRKLPEEEVSFRMLCTSDKVGSIIGKAGAFIKSVQSITGATIKIMDAVRDFDDRVILITAHETYELNHSPAQDALFRVHSRLSEAYMDKGLVSARLLVQVQQIGCLLGKGGSIITEMRQITGANIKVLANEQLPKCAQPNDELVQVTGSLQSVREALLHISNRIRETFFLPKHHPSIGMSQYPSIAQDIPHTPTPVRHPPVGFSHVLDSSLESPKNISTSSPRLWNPQSGNPKITDAGSAIQAGNVPSKTVTVAVPQRYMGFVHGDCDGNLSLIREISCANVTIYDPKPGTYEGTVVISGTQNQTTTAHGLLHAFILDGL